jgi:hypothetical protein
MGDKGKHPKKGAGTTLSAKKKPAVLQAARDIPRITWRFGVFDHGGPWPLHGISSNDHRELLEKLGVFEQSRVSELEGSSGIKNIPVENIIPQAQRRLEAIHLDDYDLWELHIKGEPRMWCIRNGEVLSLLWWDPKHEICPSHLKHT